VDSVTAVYTVTPKKPKSIEFDDQSKLRLDSDFKKKSNLNTQKQLRNMQQNAAYENAAASPNPSPVRGISGTPLRSYSSEH
jgi:hypothetical protein